MHRAKRYRGGFRCAVPQRNAQVRYAQSEKGKAFVEQYERGEGYVKRRRRILLKNRERVINQLEVLTEDGTQ